ncbi:hypothetical protein [Rhodohalobacter sp. 8-1]|uniref:hypothetical protein n=1 Tax=Rhodohalobacter sp. 8-1 TaxID=3131972 RepID=UPI0030ECE557
MIQRNLFFCVVVISCVCLFEISYCQTTIGARSIGIGQTGVALPGHQWAIFSNSSLISTNERRISFYGFRYVGISEISDLAASVQVPAQFGSIGAGFHRYGFDLFSQTQLRLGYKKQFKQFHAGLSINYSHVQQGGGYGSAGALGLNLGLAAQILESLWFGARATNINQPAYGPTDEYLSRDLAIGLSYFPSPRVMITVDAVKDVRFPMSLRAGAEVELISGFRTRAGITTHPETYGGGLGYDTDLWQINIGFQQHIPLGLSPAIDIGVSF